MKFGRAPTTFKIFMLYFVPYCPARRFPMMKLVGMMFLISQLTGPGSALQQILHPDFKPTAPLKAGKRGEVTVSFTALKGYAIDRTLPLTLKLTAVPGLELVKSDLVASGNDPKAKDQYFV